MHRWDSALNPPPKGVAPIAWCDAADHGATTARLRGRSWRRSSRGFYVPSDIALEPHQRIIEAAVLLPESGAVGGWASAYWRGVRLLDGQGAGGRHRENVLLCLGPAGRIRPRSGIDLSRERLPASEVEEIRDLTCTIGPRTAFDGARKARSLYAAVVFLDMMLTGLAVTLPELQDYWADAWRFRGLPRANRALSLAQFGSRSPPETGLRLLWVVEAGFTKPLLNAPVFSLDGQLLGYPDILDEEAGTVLEYDGDEHRDIGQHTADNAREELFEDHGLIVCRAGRLDLGPRRQQTLDRVMRARSRGQARDRSLDRWTLDPPAWWRRP